MARAIGKMSWEKYALRPVQNGPPATLPVFIYGTAWKKDRTADLVPMDHLGGILHINLMLMMFCVAVFICELSYEKFKKFTRKKKKGYNVLLGRFYVKKKQR